MLWTSLYIYLYNIIFLIKTLKGLPTPVVAVTDLESLPPNKRNQCKQDIQKLINKWLPDEKLMALDRNADGINILRKIGQQKRRPVTYRDCRPHLYADNVEYVPDSEGDKFLPLSKYLLFNKIFRLWNVESYWLLERRRFERKQFNTYSWFG